MADDFFVRFGSNARVFSRGLESDLTPAYDAVARLGKGLQALEVTAAAKRTAVSKHLVAISEEAAEVQRRLDALGEPGAKGESAELNAIARNAMQQVASVTTEIQGMMDGLGTFMQRIDRAGAEYQAAQEKSNRSAGQRDSEANRSRVRDERGRTATPAPGARPFYESKPDRAVLQQVAAAAAAAANRAAPAEPVQTPVRITEIPRATIDEASFARVVGAVEQNVEATRAVESAIDRIASQLNRSRVFQGPTPEPGAPGGQVESQIEGLARLTKQQNSELYRAFKDTLSTMGDSAGPEAQQKLWQQLVANQQKALAAGGTIIPASAGGAPEAPDSRVGQARLNSLTKAMTDLGGRASVLRGEVEGLSRSLEEARNGGRETAGEAEVLGRKLNELANVESRMASVQQAYNDEETRAEQRERQRRAAARQAAAQAGLTDTADERRRKQNERQALELGANPERLGQLVGRGQGQLGKRDLQGIAETFQRQGYGVNLGGIRPETGLTRLSVDELLKRIATAGQQYIAAGRATSEDLRPRRLEATSQVSGDVQQLIGEGTRVSEMTQRFTQELGRMGLSVQKAYELIGLSMKTGGQDPRVLADPRGIRPGDKTASGRLQVGAAIGDELRDQVAEAGNVIEAFQRQFRDAARSDVIGAVRQNQLFNPYAADRTIEGKGEEAQQARRALGAVLRATDELDDFARDLGQLDDQVKKTERAWLAVTRAIAQYESLDRAPTQEESDRYTQNVPRQAQIEQRLEAQRAALETQMRLYKDPAGGSADYLLQPGAREGLRRRDEYRVASRPDRSGRVSYQSIDSAYAEYENRDAPEKFQNRAAIRAAVFEYLGRAKIFGTNEGNTRDYFTRALPGVRGAGTAGRERLEFIDEDKNRGEEGAKNRRALGRMTAGMAGYSSNLTKLIEQMADSESTEDELNATREKLIRSLNRLLTGYQTAFKEAPVPDERLFLPPQLFEGHDQSDQNVSRQAQAAREQARRDKLEADARTAYEDPGRAEAERKRRLAEARATIRRINEQLRDPATAADARPDLEAERNRAREARKRLTGRIDPADLEKEYEAIQVASQRLARAETTLATTTVRLTKIREELAARELATRSRLPQEVQGEFDQRVAERDRLRSQIRGIETGPDIRADRGEAALDPKAQKAAADAATALGELRRQLGTVEADLTQFERYAGALDPRLQREAPFADPSLRPLNARSGGSVATEDIETEGLRAALKSSEETELRNRRQVAELGETIKASRATLQELIQGFRALNNRRGDKALAEPLLPGFNTPGAGGAGGGAGTPPSAGAGADEPGRGGPDILRQILAAINKVDATLKSGVRVTGGGRAGTGEREVRVAPDRGYQPRSTDQGRADFEQSIASTIPAVGQLLEASQDVDAAAALVTRGIMSETAVLNLFRDRLKLTAAETKQFLGQVRGAVGDQRLAAAAQAAEEQKKKEEARQFATRTGETMNVGQAKSAMRDDLAERKRKTEASIRSAREEREAALGAEAHARATAKLTAETRKEIAELERMARAAKEGSVSQAELAAQMAKVYGLASQDLGTRSTETNQTVGRIYKGAGIDTSGGEIDTMRREARGLGYQVDRSAAAGVVPGGLFGEQSAFTQALFGNHGFWSRIMNSTGTFVVRNFTAGFVFGMTAALQQVITEAIQTEATFVRVSHALEATGRSADGLRGDLQDISTDLGTNLNDVYQTAAGLTGLFRTPQEIAGATRVVSQLQLISSGALNAQEAMGTLASIQGAFGEQLGAGIDGLTHVADVLTSVQNDIGTNVEVTAESVGRMSGLAHQLGLSYEEVAVYGAQIAKLTNQTGAAAGEQFSRILSVMQTGRGRSAISDAFGTVNGQETNVDQLLSARDYSGVLKLMSQEWGNLTDAQRQNVSVSVAGQRQAAAFAALMANGAQSLDAIARAENSHGAAAERTEKIMRTLNGQIEKLGSNLQNVANNLIRSGILNFILVILQATNGLLGAFNSVFSTVNDFADSNPILNWLTNVGFGIVGLALAIAVLKRSFNGLRATLREMPAVASFQAGYRGVDRSVTGAERTVGDRIAGRGRDALNRVTPIVRPERSADVGAPASRFVGRQLDRFVIPPFQAVGNQATRLSEVLRERANLIRTTTAPLSLDQIDRNQRRAARIDRGASIAGGAGGFLGTLGAGGREIFRGRGADYFDQVAERRRESASYYRSGAAQLRQQATDPRLLPQEGAALRRQASVLTGLGVAASGASRVTSGLSSGLGALAKSGVAADAALGAVALGVAAVTYAMDQNAAAGRKVQNILEERAKSEAARTGQGETYKGPAQEAYAEFQKGIEDRNPFATGLEFGGHAIVDFLKGRSDKVFSGETYNEMTGTTDGWASNEITGLKAAQDAVDDGIKRIGDYAEQGKRKTGKVTVPTGIFGDLGITLFEGFDTASEGVTVAQKELATKFGQMEDDVKNNKDLSNQEKLASLAAIEQARQAVIEQAEAQLAISQGLSEAGLLELEQIKRIVQALPTLGGLQASPQILQELKGGVTGLIEETGVDENNPEIQQYLQDLQRGGLSAAEQAVGQTEVIRALAKQAEIKYQAALALGEQEQIDDARDQMVSLMGQLASAAENNVQTFVSTANAISEAAFAEGDFEAGRAAINQAIQDINAQKPKGVSRVEPGGRGQHITTFTDAEQEQIRAFEAQQRQLIDRLTQSRIQERNAPLQLAAAPGLGEVGNAQNQLSQAQNTLGALKRSRNEYGTLGATAQQINDAEVAVLQAQAQVAQSLQNQTAAQAATKAAGLWNQARVDNINVQQAALALEQAIARYGEDSIEALNAMAALATANKTRLQNADARAQARRETALAAIPQGNQSAVTQQQLANAQAGVAAAEKYGRNSTEYQGALQQLYSAQQAASSATANIAVAQAQLAQAYAQASGNAVAAAQAGVAVARATLAQALQASGGAVSAEVLGAQAQLVAANQAVQDAQVALVQSRIQVTIALAEAAGQTVRASRLQIAAAVAALEAETPGTAEYNQAKAQVISARAAARDAELQDKLDTIDFNLQMGKITQSAAITALQQILRTSDLTKQQRRQLLLQIKGMKDEMADSQWNFGDIKLPTPYQMRRYIAERRDQFRSNLEASAAASGSGLGAGYPGGGPRRETVSQTTQYITIPINGADTAKVKKIIGEVVGTTSGTVVRTTGARRN